MKRVPMKPTKAWDLVAQDDGFLCNVFFEPPKIHDKRVYRRERVRIVPVKKAKRGGRR